MRAVGVAERPMTLRLGLGALPLALVTIALGAFTRLADAGLGCPDWPGCYGQLLWPDSDAEIVRANLAWPEAPVDTSKTWPEMVHRYAAGLLGLMILAIALSCRGSAAHTAAAQPQGLARGLLVLVICQALFGMWTVTLKLWPQVVALHLLGGFATLALLVLLVLRCDRAAGGELLWQRLIPPPGGPPLASLLPWGLSGMGLLVLQIALGGWTTANYAALACPELPTCQGSWWPPADFLSGFNVMQSVGPNYLGGMMEHQARVAIHVSHRVVAVILLLYLGGLAWALWRRWARAMALLLAVLLGAQFVLGLGNVLLGFPLWVAVAHNLGGALLLVVLVVVNYILWSVARGHRMAGGR